MGKNFNKRMQFEAMMRTNARLRTDDMFLTYHVNDFSKDQHLPNSALPSPFLVINFPMVSGFVLDPMHTVYEGAFLKRLVRFVSMASEGNLSKWDLTLIDRRLKYYRKCRPSEFNRYLGSLQDFNYYKAHVLRQFFYYLLFPVIDGILHPDILEKPDASSVLNASSRRV